MPDTRDRLVQASAALLQRQGLTGTGIKQILTEARAPYSSLYHHFPGGKDELAEVAIHSSGAQYQALVEAVWDQAPDLVGAVAAVFEGAAQALESTDFAVACPIATVALEVAGTNERLRMATAEVFETWIESGRRRLEAQRVSPRDARMLALTLISLLEGAFVLSQALKSTEPVLAAEATAVLAVERMLATRAAPTTRPNTLDP